jgi:hypothetical protein
VFVVVGLLIGLGPLNDNSFLTHLATGRVILDTHHIPHSDIYSWSAPGHPWVVQSWLASVIYAVGDKYWGPSGPLVVVGVSAAVLAGLVWALTKPAGSLIVRVVLMGLMIVIGLEWWVERPLLFGLLALALTLLAAEGRLKPVWLIPVFWVWVNTHGSFPLGLLAIALLAIGRKLDGGDPSTELATLKWAAIGTVVGGVLNPLGPRLLWFPVELVMRRDALQNVIEWQAPTFRRLSQYAFLVVIVLVFAALARRPSWRLALPALIFIPASLLGSRNIVIACIVLVPPLAWTLRGIGDITGEERKPVYRVAALMVMLLGLLILVVKVESPAYLLRDYPLQAITWAERNGKLDENTHMVTRDYAGNYIDLRYGGRIKEFIDDRYDMYPQSVIDDYTLLNDGKKGWDAALRERSVNLVIWDADSPFGQLLLASPDWKIIYTDSNWLVAEPR